VYILDTCILNILFFYPGPKRDAVVREMRRVGKEQVCISAISIWELVGNGAVPEVNKYINKPEEPQKLYGLMKVLDKLANFHVLHFTERAYGIFNTLPAATKQRGVWDARIAASALTDKTYIVVTEDNEVFDLAGAPNINWARLASRT
jgi:predicted nucleic acid-binding protein